ncbi:MAG: carboxynorspermidine decarboxylase [Oscillospiraceae bacterium]|nr:carboxynorspermidine decarboxylase [Oscillospiraceae bacterium]
MLNFDINSIKTPCFVVDENLLKKNLEVLKSVEDRTGCKILLAQKSFSMYSLYPMISEYLCGTTASGLYEARLGYEEMGRPFYKETHIFSPAYIEEDFDEILKYCDHIVFNSLRQWNMFKDRVKDSGKKIECGIRINPEYSEIETDIYNPCFTGSRLGALAQTFEGQSLDGISGLHFHTMCEQNSDTLERTIKVVDEKFGRYLKNMKWINFGGGHHITRDDYDIDTLCRCIMHFKDKYGLQVYLEPGEAVALNAGFMVTTVLDTLKNGCDIAIIDASAACHMPDVIEMPYRPNIINSGMPGEKRITYRLGGNTCLAGDIVGDYSFDKELDPGDKLVLCDMAIYSMVKTNTFNGMKLPSIAVCHSDGTVETVRTFGYGDFKCRL